jgi:flavin reductase (DIM6/NTAB) family NADH-FMN oxidoreductase RutF
MENPKELIMNDYPKERIPNIMSVDPEDFRLAMRRWATGVTVVTTQYQGVRHGMTVNSFTSISLTPPLVLVSLERKTRTHSLVEKSGVFGITVLSENQQTVSDCFAGRCGDHDDRFANLSTHTLLTEAPFIEGGIVFFDCRVVSTFAASTHTLFIGEVIASQLGIDDQPLIYLDRMYRRMQV